MQEVYSGIAYLIKDRPEQAAGVKFVYVDEVAPPQDAPFYRTQMFSRDNYIFAEDVEQANIVTKAIMDKLVAIPSPICFCSVDKSIAVFCAVYYAFVKRTNVDYENVWKSHVVVSEALLENVDGRLIDSGKKMTVYKISKPYLRVILDKLRNN